ncbi:CDP-alcohol phosphatidyltransferase family protein, partial [Candidatus Sumerlaeota bacterium]|nr:CDP-alcohol phosphatidyltransferase family protein [Candidatus Sumerlaeota bacterium]
MDEYKPTSRRPIADIFRGTAHGAVKICVRLGIHPDAVSYASIAAAAGAGACFWKAHSFPWLLVLGPLLCYLRLWFNMLDGMVAIASRKASLRGEILNDLPDRISDVLIFVGVAHGGLAHLVLGYWSAIFALLVAYVGMFGQAVGVQREFSGLMSKPWRMVVLSLGSFATFILGMVGTKAVSLGGLSILDCALVLVLAGSVQTIWVRLARIMAA